MSMRILLTGSHGFFGQHVAAVLRYPVFSLIPLAHSAQGDRTRVVDLADLVETKKLFRSFSPAPLAILHLAGRVPKQGVTISAETYEKDNLRATENLVRAAEALRHPPQIIFASTAGVYPPGLMLRRQGRNAIVKAREEDVLTLEGRYPPEGRGMTDYVRTKLQAESAVRAYRGPWTILRFPTLVGAGDKRGNFLRSVANMLMTQTTPTKKQMQRCADYVAVQDAAKACAAVLDNSACDGEDINIGSGRATTGFELWRVMKKAGEDMGFHFADLALPAEERDAVYPGTILATKKAEELLSFTARTSLSRQAKMVWRDIARQQATYT